MTRRTGTALAKLVLVGGIVWLALGHSLTNHALDAQGLGSLAWSVVGRALAFVLCALVALGAVDFFLAKRRMTTQMKMTSEETKREHKESDGDPMMKGKRKARMRELAKRRMAAAVATADVIVVNPTHYAVALRYDETRRTARRSSSRRVPTSPPRRSAKSHAPTACPSWSARRSPARCTSTSRRAAPSPQICSRPSLKSSRTSIACERAK